MKRLALIAAVTAVVGVWPAASSAATFKGVVVAKQRGALLVASPAGLIRSVSGTASIGSRVELSGGQAIVIGRAHTAHLRGIVVRRIGTTVFLSSNKHLVAVHTGRRLSSVSTTPPITTSVNGTTTGTLAPGDQVSSTVTIQNGELDESSSETLGHSSAGDVQVQAVVASIGAGTVTLTVGTQTLTVPLPVGLTLPDSMKGQTVLLTLSLNGQSGNDDDDVNDDNGDNGGGD
ncbi:MAG: hypothetical protein JWM06_1277 [Actinomycetia bacterium]|jgi:hypothetical protein|nr:hypothetical protein [Actinomycetes bacterium]